jgi:uncharacterized protein
LTVAEGKVSYRAKKESVCPICDCNFHREELLTGGGRMNAGDLTDELHRIYLPTQKYGEIYPLVYPVSVCPRCWYAAYPRHFASVGYETTEILENDIETRKHYFKSIFPDLDFERDRTLQEGIASYVLAALCYEHRPTQDNPTFMCALSFLRAGWLANDLHAHRPQENFDYLAKIFLRKASFYYGEVILNEQKGTESIENIPHHGPDLDNNYGFDGVLYLVGVLLLKYGQSEDERKRAKSLKDARSAVSRIVGMGKSSKAKPSALLDLGRELHKTIKSELESLEP